MRTKFLVLAAATALVVGAASCSAKSSPSTSSRAAPTTTSSAPCGTLAAPPTYTHVIWVWMENRSYNNVIGSSQAPYINSLARQCGLATNYHNISHPSLPNYIAAASGLGLPDIRQFDTDCSPSGHCDTTAPSIFGQGETWKAYQESMPSNCDPSDSSDYAVRHNPPLYFASLAHCPTFDVPYTQLPTDLASGALPALSFVTPNLNNDMHNGTTAQGDTWLAANLPSIFNSSEYRSGTTAVFLTWDEGEGGTSNACPSNTTDLGCHVATIIISPSTGPHTASGALFNHYSLLGTTEELLRLPRLGLASSFPTMTSAFNLL
jgi:phospholipase C